MKPTNNDWVRGISVPSELRNQLLVFVQENGLRATATAIGASRNALQRALSSLPVLPGTLALIQTWADGRGRRCASRESRS